MSRKRWYAFSGLLQRTLSQSSEVTGTTFEVYNRRSQEIAGTFATRQELTTWWAANFHLYPTSAGWAARETVSEHIIPAVNRGVAVVPLHPTPLFTRPGKVLTTRGFWDVVSTTNPKGTVANFAFGMIFLPTSVVYSRGQNDDGDEVFELRDAPEVPDPLLHDAGWFAYDSFVRVTTDVNQDPPFHSKTQHRFSENSVLCVVSAVEVGVDNLTSLRLDFGIRFRVLVEH